METSGIAKRRAAAKAYTSKQYAERRKAIVAAAADVFKAKGFKATSVDDIARVAGVDRASLYYYVGSKRELFDEVVLDAVQKNIELAEQIRDGGGTAIEKLRALVEGVLQTYVAFYPQLYVFIQESAGIEDKAVIELQRRFDRALITIIEEGRAAGELRTDISPRLAAYGLVGMLNWTHRWFDPDGPVGAAEVAHAFSTITIEGLAAK
jgi:AcrR family transcriptional regulator